MISEFAKLKPSEFVEKYMNVKLQTWQKTFVDNYNPKYKYYLHSRGNTKRIMAFIQGMTHALSMKDDDVIVVIKSDGNLELNREEFIEWLMTKF